MFFQKKSKLFIVKKSELDNLEQLKQISNVLDEQSKLVVEGKQGVLEDIVEGYDFEIGVVLVEFLEVREDIMRQLEVIMDVIKVYG